MRQDFVLAFKSTIDKLGKDFGASQVPAIEFVDMDDTTAIQSLLGGSETAAIWEFMTLDEHPADPLYSFSFRIGARTIRDASNYGSLQVVGKLGSILAKSTSIPIYDYTSATPTVLQGNLFVTDTGVDPQQYDKEYGIRTIVVSGVCNRAV